MKSSAVLFLLIAFTFSPFVLSAQNRAAPSLEELIDKALLKDHVLANKKLDIESSNLELKQLKEVYLPTADISGKYAFLANSAELGIPASSFSLNGAAINLPDINAGFSSQANLFKTDLTVSALLYTGGKVPALKKALKEKTKAQTALLETDRQQIITDVSKAYDQLALLKQVKIVLDESQDRLDINAKTADKALGYGLITKYEHQKIEVAKAQLSSRRLEYEGKKNLILHQLEMFTGVEIERLAAIDNELLSFNLLDAGQSVQNRPEMKALNFSIAAYEYKVKAAQTWWIPKIQAASSLGYLNIFNTKLTGKEALPIVGVLNLRADKFEIVPNFNIGVGFKWDIFTGFKGERDVQHARIDVRKAENEKVDAEEKLNLLLLKTKTDFSNAVAEIQVKEKEKQIAGNALEQAGKEFKLGLIKAADLIGAETDYQNAALQKLQAVFNQRQAALELLKATGSLTKASIH
ncbi:Outer membrane efflux protein [Arcticibacter svalbardensis MN12-7]|uniref:Outer membrane efflux protein n=1 Tax=Arcticibacter svalbardensis MN12-7 TaxID=1150600 RepID=R9GPN6_9SPHI|nr:TolC family protein [Arcticibacter svalbardensis]EOR93648.1 Outer membrane efflux protein [Arcticibacter svalbardensis MN12-7]